MRRSELKLKRFTAASHTRLGDLIRKDRATGLTEAEEAELLKLLRTATKVSEANAQLLRAIRQNAPTKREQQSAPRPRVAFNLKK